MPEYASAFPRKRFFLEMFTRDISVEDCILDLVDNSIDALLRTRRISLSSLLLAGPPRRASAQRVPRIELTLSRDEVAITDTCGGIPDHFVLDDLFSFGHTPHYEPGLLGAYGVGLKRALFKLGAYFELTSRTQHSGFKVELDVATWAQKDDLPQDWQIPVTLTSGARSPAGAGTSIRITRLHPEVKQRFRDPTTISRIRRNASQAYTLFLNRYVRLYIDKQPVDPFPLPMAQSTRVKPGIDKFHDTASGVKVTLMAGLYPRDDDHPWTYDRAGWYIFCNGRLVTAADKTDLTGWLGRRLGLPTWHAKYNGFFGVALFEAPDPLALPWTTTKRGMNRESPIYQLARDRMIAIARPVVDFLNDMYPSDLAEHPDERDLAQSVEPVDLADVAKRSTASFKVKRESGRAKKATIKVQYDAPRADLDRVKRRLGKPRWSARRVGKHTFDHFVKKECPP